MRRRCCHHPYCVSPSPFPSRLPRSPKRGSIRGSEGGSGRWGKEFCSPPSSPSSPSSFSPPPPSSWHAYYGTQHRPLPPPLPFSFPLSHERLLPEEGGEKQSNNLAAKDGRIAKSIIHITQLIATARLLCNSIHGWVAFMKWGMSYSLTEGLTRGEEKGANFIGNVEYVLFPSPPPPSIPPFASLSSCGGGGHHPRAKWRSPHPHAYCLISGHGRKRRREKEKTKGKRKPREKKRKAKTGQKFFSFFPVNAEEKPSREGRE